MANIINRVKYRLLPVYGCIKSQMKQVMSKNRLRKRTSDYPIDFVVTWVDGSDPAWQESREKYRAEMADQEENSPCRYRDWGLMRYWFRAVEQYAPWVRKVFFVTCGQKPEWLDLSNEKLVFVTHKDFMPDRYLPTFNSRSIEMNLWRIEGLSEHFVYFNDDVFLNREVVPEDFFENGLPKYCSLAVPFYFRSPSEGEVWKRALLNDIGIINDTFDIQQSIRNYPEKFFSYKYARQARYNWRIYEDGYISGMYYAHTGIRYLKSTFQEIWDSHQEVMDRSCAFRFRNSKQVTVLLPILWMIFEGKYEPVEASYYGRGIGLNGRTVNKFSEVLQSNARTVCFNDGLDTDAEDEQTLALIYRELQNAMRYKFPEQSGFELW